MRKYFRKIKKPRQLKQKHHVLQQKKHLSCSQVVLGVGTKLAVFIKIFQTQTLEYHSNDEPEEILRFVSLLLNHPVRRRDGLFAG